MPQMPLLTDWLTICTAGPTVDGRMIEEAWLTQAAKSYDREEYAAFVNCEHGWGNLGTVWELRTGRDKKKRLTLEARIRVNKQFMLQNAEGLRLCFSAEFIHNFAGTGETYLVGLATTDTPASLGTTETHFNRREDENFFAADPVETEVFDLRPNDKTGPAALIGAVREVFREMFPQKNQKRELQEMTKDEFKEAFSEAMKPFQEGLTKLTGKVETLSAPPKEEGVKADPSKKEPEKDELTAKTLSAAIGDALKPIGEAVEQLSAKFDELSKDIPPKGNTAGSGEEDAPLV